MTRRFVNFSAFLFTKKCKLPADPLCFFENRQEIPLRQKYPPKKDLLSCLSLADFLCPISITQKIL